MCRDKWDCFYNCIKSYKKYSTLFFNVAQSDRFIFQIHDRYAFQGWQGAEKFTELHKDVKDINLKPDHQFDTFQSNLTAVFLFQTQIENVNECFEPFFLQIIL